jgi:hypothetical protein
MVLNYSISIISFLTILSFVFVDVNGICLKRTTTPSQCTPTLKFTNSFGNSKNSQISKKISLAGLTKLTIYSGNYVDAIQFDYDNGNVEFMGSGSSADTTSIVVIDMNNKIISGVKLQHSDAINSIQFQIHDPQTNTKIWSEKFGGSDGVSSTLLDFDQELVLNSIYYKSNQNYIQFLIFGYYSFKCTSLQLSSKSTDQCNLYSGTFYIGDKSNNYMVPSDYKTTPLSTTTMPTTTQPIIVTTTNSNMAFVRIVIGQNRTYENRSIYKSDLFNSDGVLLAEYQNEAVVVTTTLFPGDSTFKVLLSDLRKINIYSGFFINALEFEYKDGSKEIYGDVQNPDTSTIERIDLTNQVVTGINVQADWAIRSLQFQLYDLSTNTYSLISEIGTHSGNLLSINKEFLNAESANSGGIGEFKMMNVYSLSGMFRENYPVKLNVDVLYIYCQ